MASIFSFKCSSCDQIHEGAPSFAYNEPASYSDLTEDDKKNNAKIDSDLCCIKVDENRFNFIRVCLEIPIHNHTEPFIWGVWVSLSDENFARYIETWDSPVESDCYFGWFNNRLPYYPNTLSLKTNVHPRLNGIRPSISLELTDHPLSIDYHEGISIARAQEIAELVMHRS